jgi:hypothetical protein
LILLTEPSRNDCELPDGSDRHFEQDDSKLSNLEQRFTRLEEKFDELSSLVRRVIDHSAGPRASVEDPVPELQKQPEITQARSESQRNGISDSESDQIDEESEPYIPQPGVLSRNLQSRFFGRKGDFTSESFMLGDVVIRGLINLDLAEKLLPMFAHPMSAL